MFGFRPRSFALLAFFAYLGIGCTQPIYVARDAGDGGGDASASPCDFVTLAGCDPSLDCIRHSDRTTSCGTAGALGEGQSCADDTECLAGMICMSAGTVAGTKTCHVVCDLGAPDSCPNVASGSVCAYTFSGNTTPGPATGLCSEACTPTTNAGCANGLTCLAGTAVEPDAGVPSVFTICTGSSGGGTQGGPCQALNDCAAGLVCQYTGESTPGTCRQACSTSGTTCPGFCNFYTSSLNFGGTALNLCSN